MDLMAAILALNTFTKGQNGISILLKDG